MHKIFKEIKEKLSNGGYGDDVDFGKIDGMELKYRQLLEALRGRSELLQNTAVNNWYKASKMTRVEEMIKVIEAFDEWDKMTKAGKKLADLDPAIQAELRYRGFTGTNNAEYKKAQKRYINNHSGPINNLENIEMANISDPKQIPDKVREKFNDLSEEARKIIKPC